MNPIDLISLEVLRVFEPAVYHLLPRSKERLTERYDSQFRVNMTDRENRERLKIEELVNAAEPEHKDVVEEILKQLFPKVTTGNDDLFYRELRVCHVDVFDRYFLLSIPEGDVSQADLDDLLASTNDREQLVAKFNAFRKRDLLATVLDRLESYKQQVSLEHAVPFITAIFDIGDDLPEENGGVLTISTWMHASRIIRWYLMTEPDIAKRSEYLAKAINASDGLYLPAMKIALEFDSKKEGRPQSERMLDDASAEVLKQICVEKIREAAASGKLENQLHLGMLLGIWAEWAGPTEPKTWVEKLIQSREGLITFFVAMTGKTTSYGGAGEAPREVWYMQLPAIEKFIDLKVLERQFEKIKPQSENEPESRAITAFQQALERRRSGKPDGSPFLDWQA